MNQYGQNMNMKSNMGGNDGALLNKRQRLLNLMKNTKDSYMHGWSSGLPQRTLDSIRGTDSENPPDSNLPLDMDIQFYPTYTTKSEEGYETMVRLAVFSPGNPASRRNRILLSLCKQYLRPANPEAVDDANESKFDDPSTSESTLTAKSSASTLTLNGLHDNGSPAPDELDVLKSRIAGFMIRKIPNLPIIIDLLSREGPGYYDTTLATTNNIGNISLRIRSEFLPTDIRITLDTPTDFPKVITHRFPCNFIKPNGYGVISDIDDTIKHTGVTGDKRSMFRSVFLNDINTWLINDVSRWYKKLKELFQADFFYVSNSPVQTYPTLYQYVSNHFPAGPLFLKQYTGNLLSSIMTSSANRKLGAITQILKDFPNKKFILIGDSGEQDFEAYLSTASQYQEQICGIYIRCCKDSLSDMGLRETEVMHELNDIISEQYLSHKSKETRKKRPPPPVSLLKPDLSPEQQKEIKESRLKPKNRDLPTLPPRPSEVQDLESSVYCTPSTQNDYGTYNQFFDKKADAWRSRVLNGVRTLKSFNKDKPIRVMFFTDPKVPLEDYVNEVQRE